MYLEEYFAFVFNMYRLFLLFFPEHYTGTGIQLSDRVCTDPVFNSHHHE